MCRSPNPSANHGLADGTRSVPATFVGHVFLHEQSRSPPILKSAVPDPGANPLDKPKHVTNTAIARLFHFIF